MKHVLKVCLIALVAETLLASAAAQSPQLQKGISVQLVATHHAIPVPNADRQDAFIVTVTEDGSTYLGVDPITLPELGRKTQSTPFRRDQAAYIKADGRSRYSTVQSVIEATQSKGMIPQVLLTSQPDAMQLPITPRGLVVSPSSEIPRGTVVTLVEMIRNRDDSSQLKINGDEIELQSFVSTLDRHFQKGDAKAVLLNADALLRFAEVVNAIDACRATGAKVFLGAPAN